MYSKIGYMNFWDTLLKQGPIVGLSPMDGVTDAPMRYMTATYGRPKIVFTEFVSVDALRHAKDPEAIGRLMTAFVRAKDVNPGGVHGEWPYEIAQVFGHDPELFYQAAVIIATLGYDGMDVNMGCPMHKVEDHGSGAGLIRTPEVAKEIVRQSKKGIHDYAEGTVSVDSLAVSHALKEWVLQHTPQNGERAEIPVSVKTRIGVDSIVVEDWMRELMQVEPAMISLHGRTLKQLYQGQADWSAIARAADVVHGLGGHILGNGDVKSLADGLTKVKTSAVDGFLIGRAAEGNPGVFQGIDNPDWETRKAWMLEHTALYEGLYGAAFFPMRKHLAWYCKGFEGAGEMRDKLVRANSALEVSGLLGITA